MDPAVVAALAAATAAAGAFGSGAEQLLARRLATSSSALPRPDRSRHILAVATILMLAVAIGFSADRPHFVVLTLVAAAVAAAALRLVAQGRARAARLARRSRAIEVCDALVAELRAGQPPVPALRHLAQEWAELESVAAAAGLGGDIPSALRSVSLRPGAEPLAQLAAGWDVAHQSGAGLADVLDRLSAALRGDEDVRLEIAGALGPPRATARLLAVLPLFGAGLGAGLGGDPLRVLFGSTFGALCLAGGTVLAVIGLFWVEHIAAQAEV